jgi:serine/threonine-protein kinase
VAKVARVIGKTQAEASTILGAAQFLVVAKHRYSDTAPVGEVIDQAPGAGTKLQEGSTVTIFVSQGPRPVTLRDYAGQPAATVEAALRDLGLVPTEAKAYSTTVQRGDVIGTDPSSGQVVHHGDRITVVVSLGPKTFPMPSVVGLPLAQAKAELERMGLIVDARKIPGSTGSTVVSQIPAAGTIVQQGATVRLYWA